MELPAELNEKIIEFLESLSIIQDSNGQQAFINSAGLDVKLYKQIKFGDAVGQFVKLLVPKLVGFE